MPDHKPSEPSPSDFKEAAQRSQDAGIADESAAYTNAENGDSSPVDKDGAAAKDGAGGTD